MSIESLRENIRHAKEILREMYVFTNQLNIIKELESKGETIIDSREKKLLNEAGVTTAKNLLTKLGQPKLDNEKNSEYEKRIDEEVFEILEIDINDS